MKPPVLSVFLQGVSNFVLLLHGASVLSIAYNK